MSCLEIRREEVGKIICGIKFAPLKQPRERRLELLALIIFHGLLVSGPFICSGICCLIIFFAWEWLRFLLVLYFIFMYFDLHAHRKGGTRQPFAQWFCDSTLVRYACEYFPMRLVKTTDLNPTKNYLFCTFPHGLIPLGAHHAFVLNSLGSAEKFPGLCFKTLTIDAYFYAPLFREVLLAFGLGSVDLRSIEYLLESKPTKYESRNNTIPQGRASILFVGGASEALKSKPKTYNLSILKKKGFIKVALKYGTPIVPVLTFGETDLYDQWQFAEGSFIRSCQELFKDIFGFAPIFPIGRGIFQYSFGIIPHRAPLTTVVGGPIELPKISDPPDELINMYHAKFCKELVQLFEAHKSKYIEYHEEARIVIE